MKSLTRQKLLVGIPSLLLSLATAVPAAGQAVLVLPLENRSRTSEQGWLSEGIAEGIAAYFRGRVGSETRFAIRREERMAAFDQLGLPPAIGISHATVIKIAELTGADLVITGSFEGEAQRLTLTARALDMRHPHLGPILTESGPFTDLLAMQDRLAVSLATSVGLSAALSGDSLGTVSGEAWESYIRALTAGPVAEQAKRFREAVRLDPGFMAPAFQLGRIAFRNGDYSGALLWLSKPGPHDPNYLEATFFLGLSAYHLREWEKAATAFRTVAESLPLNEAFNNIGVVEARQHKRTAVEDFEKAIDGDPNDPDYSFNLGLYYLRTGDFSQAARYLRESLAKQPGDSEARALLNHAVAGNAGGDLSATERLKTNYEEPNFRQFRMTLRRAEEDKLETLPEADHGATHVERGREYYDRGDDVEAIAEFREAVKVRPGDARSYLYLAKLYMRGARTDEAVAAAQRASEISKKDPEGPLLLARIYKDQGKTGEARDSIREALDRDPNNSAALELQRGMGAKPQ